ncbi:MAG: DUF3866 family protein [Candidatus Geothermincolia bacterium]
MSSFRSGKVVGVKRWGPDICVARLEFSDGSQARGIVLEQITGGVDEGDEVVANTTAEDLGLGSGGYHFVLWNLSLRSLDTGGRGHIMKLRYTPLQVNVEVAEERLRDLEMDDLGGVLEGMPVVAGELHSQLLPVALAYREARPDGKLAYVMTDGGCLPASFSHAARFLMENGYLESVISCGHAFGGDLEAVTVYGALVAAKSLLGADAAVVLMGPGIVGTGSVVGFSGIEQGETVNATASLGGTAIAMPRITFGDERDRHRGLSHHTVAALKYAARARAIVPVPFIEGERGELVRKQVVESGLDTMHDVRSVDAAGVLDLLDRCEAKGSVMGRGPDLEPEFFLAAGAAGLLAAGIGGGS